MSKANAFKCDNCNTLYLDSEVIGINPTEDITDKYASYPSVPNPEKAIVHYCLPCYRRAVTYPLQRLVGTDEYNYQYKIMFYTFRKSVVLRFNKIKSAQRLRGR